MGASLREILGLGMFAIPFLGLFAMIWLFDGWKLAVGIFGGVAALVVWLMLASLVLKG